MIRPMVREVFSSWSGTLGMLAVRGRSIDHEKKAVFGRRELGDVMLGMGAAYVFLHRTISLLADASFPTTRSIVISQRTDDLIVGVCN